MTVFVVTAMIFSRLKTACPVLWLGLASSLVAISVNAEIRAKVNQAEPIYIAFAQMDLVAQENVQVSATLGNYDITSLVSYDNTGFYLMLNGGVEAGRYDLHIVMLSADGEHSTLVDEVVRFSEISHHAGFEFRSATTYRVDESDADDFAQSVRRMSESALRLQARRLGKNTTIASSADLQHRSDANTISGEKLEIANFHVGVEHKTGVGNLGFAVGNQRIDQQGIVFNGFNRRGISAHIESDSKSYHAKTFVINTEAEVSAKEDVIIPSEKHEKSVGAIVGVEVFKAHPGRLRMSGGYIDGQSELRGAGLAFSSGFFDESPDPIAYGGKTWHVSADSAWWEQALLLQAELARSRFDSDGFEIGEDELERIVNNNKN